MSQLTTYSTYLDNFRPERLKSMRWESLHEDIKQVFDSLVPSSFRVGSKRQRIPPEAIAPAQLAEAMKNLVAELSTRPERSTLCDIELNHMMSAVRRWENQAKLGSTPAVPLLPPSPTNEVQHPAYISARGTEAHQPNPNEKVIDI